MSPNKSVVEKSQKILEEYGYQVKTGHLYELFSKLSNQPSWNVAKAKDVDFVKELSLESEVSVISPEEAESSLNEALLERKRVLLKTLKESINQRFKSGYKEFNIDESYFRDFRNVYGLEDLQSFLAELETKGYLLDANPKENVLVISLKQTIKKTVVDTFREFLIHNKKGAVDVKNFLADYEKRIANNFFSSLMTYGIKDDGSYLTVDPFKQPGSLFCGGMGSGKSMSGRFTALTHKLSNGHNSVYFFVDPLKGAADFKYLWDPRLGSNKDNAISVLHSQQKVIDLIEFLDREITARRELLLDGKFTNLKEYNLKTKQSVAEIHVFIEEFYSIPNSPEMKFHQNVDKEGSPANKFRLLMRIGRSYGIFFNVLTQRATFDDVPSSIKAGLSTMMCFRVNNPGDAAALNIPLAQEISMNDRGRCAYEEGFLQFPYLNDDEMILLIKKHAKPFKAKLLSSTVAELQVLMRD